MKNIFLLLLLVSFSATAQTFFPMRKGAVLEYKYRDEKGKTLRDSWRNERFLRFTVEEIWGDSVANVVVENEAFERYAKNTSIQPAIADLCYGDVRVTPQEVIFDNMQWLFTGIPPENFAYMPEELPKGDKYFEGFTFRVRADAVSTLPRELHAGDSLPDWRYEVVYREEITEELAARRKESYAEMEEIMMSEFGERWKAPETMGISLTASVNNRYVVGKEMVTVPAGEWECWKITYEVVGPTERNIGIPERFQPRVAPVVTKYVDYMSPEVGLVRREKMNGTGRKVEEMMELDKIL